MLLKGGVKEDEALQLLANYRRPYPGFYEPNDLPYAEEEAVISPVEPSAEVQSDGRNAGTPLAPEVDG